MRLPSIIFAVLFISLPIQESEAHQLLGLISRLESNYITPSTKQLTLARLEESGDPRAVAAILRLLKRKSESPYLRGEAALSLARMKASWVLPTLKQYRRSRNRVFRRKIRSALRVFCPSRIRGKRFYISLKHIRIQGPHSEYVKKRIILYLQKWLRSRGDVTTAWQRCRKPSRRALRRKRMKGYNLRLKISIYDRGQTSGSKIKLLFTSFPGNSIRASNTVRFNLSAGLSRSVLNKLIEVTLPSLKEDIQSFLLSQ